jgi:ribosomal protein S6
VNRYEGLVILTGAAVASEDAIKEAVDHLQKLIQQSNGKIETVQKLGQRPFARDLGTETSGYYVNFLFRAPPTAIAELDAKLHLESTFTRWQFVRAEEGEKRPLRRPREELGSETPDFR